MPRLAVTCFNVYIVQDKRFALFHKPTLYANVSCSQHSKGCGMTLTLLGEQVTRLLLMIQTPAPAGVGRHAHAGATLVLVNL